MYDFRLQRTDGSPFDPPTYRSSMPSQTAAAFATSKPKGPSCRGLFNRGAEI